MDPLANSCGADVEDAGDVAPREIRVGRAEPEPGELGEALFRVHAAATRADVIGADAVVGDFVDECAVADGAGTPGGDGIQPVRFAQPSADFAEFLGELVHGGPVLLGPLEVVGQPR